MTAADRPTPARPIYTPHLWTEFEQPTPEQFAVWLEAMTHDERVELSRRMLQDRAAADRCFIENHLGQLAELVARRRTAETAQLAERRQVVGNLPTDTSRPEPAAGTR